MVITKTMTDEQFFLDKLKHRDIRPTATRLLILREMMRGDEAVSLPDLERYLPTVDKSTISRTIKRGERRLQRCLRYGAEAYLRGMD